MKNIFMPADVASRLDIGVSTLRKYSLLLEDNGMIFKRNAQNSRIYDRTDVVALQRMITLIREHNITVENAAVTISSSTSGGVFESDDSVVIHNGVERHSGDVAGVTLTEVMELKEIIERQTETIEEFRKTQEKRDQYFLKILEDLNEQILQLKEKQALPEPGSNVEQLKDKVNPNTTADERKGFFARLFKR